MRFTAGIALFLAQFLFSDVALLGQTNENQSSYYVNASGHYGFLWAHRDNMLHLYKQHIGAVEFSVWKSPSGFKSWHKQCRGPQIGAALMIVPLGNPEELGTAIGLYPYLNFPLVRGRKNFSLSFRWGWGIGYVTKKFDRIENHKNIAIGSHFNAAVSFRLNAMWQAGERYYVETGVGITHFSNGAVTLPNLGLNIPMLHVGVHYRIKKLDCQRKTNESPEKIAHTDSLVYNSKWHLAVVLAGGCNQAAPIGGNRFGLVTVQSSYMKNTSRKHRFGGGLDLMYSQALRHAQIIDSVPVSVLENVQVGVKFSHELVLGRVSFPMEAGVYAYTKYKGNVPIYSRLGVRYLVTDHLLVHFSLKTHFAKAEYLDAGFGWRF
ncbi:MAG TPA: acyloxyacyl hydrolase [Bacteroidia bacterium]|nr:acyloxyacyl hydrolase [Bacteroidia bacterium]